jgi:hypothetical protein
MNNRLLLLALILPLSLAAQTNSVLEVKIVSPLDYQVFQRQNRTNGTVVVEATVGQPDGSVFTDFDTCEVRLVTVSGTNESSTSWQALPPNDHAHIRAMLAAPAGGWYRFEIRIRKGSHILCSAAVPHVGIGEVFVIAGQSNSANHGEERQQPKSGLISAMADGTWRLAGDPEPGASGSKGSFIPAFGDAMAGRFHVPIGIVAVGVGSTSIREWLPKNRPIAKPPTTGRHVLLADGQWVSTGELFDRLVHAETTLGKHGFRAVLWHQGESDIHQPAANDINPDQYHAYLRDLIEATRSAAGWPAPWFVAQVSYHSPTDTGSPELRAAQRAVVNEGLAFAGPDTDALGPEFREKDGRGIHFNARGLQRHGELWADAVSAWLERNFGDEKERP